MSKDNTLVSTINGTGAVIETVYVLIFLFYAPKKEKAKIFGVFTAVLAVFATVALVSLFALHGNARKLFCGIAATVFSIIMYASPLSIMVSKQNQESIKRHASLTSAQFCFKFVVIIFDFDNTEIGDKDEECRVYAILSLTLCVPLWNFLVHLWSHRS